jgi:hypothetical protein
MRGRLTMTSTKAWWVEQAKEAHEFADDTER